MPMLSAPSNNSLTADYTPYLNWSLTRHLPAIFIITRFRLLSGFRLHCRGGHLYKHGLGIHLPHGFDSQRQILLARASLSMRRAEPVTGPPRATSGRRSCHRWRRRRAWTCRSHAEPAHAPPDLHLAACCWSDGLHSGSVHDVVDFKIKAINGTTSATSYTHTSDLAANTTFYWRVKANGANGPSAYSSPVKIFSTGNPPSIPTLKAPMNNALLTTTTPLLDWNNSTVPSGTPAFDRYQVQIASDNVFSTIVSTLDVPGISNSQVVAPTLLNGTTYYWRVRSWNVGVDGVGGNADDDFSGWSSVRSLRIAYAAPVLTLPLDAAIGVALKPTFTWDAIPGATTYNLQVSKSSTFAGIAGHQQDDQCADPPPTPTPCNLTPNTTYYWRVRANGSYGHRLLASSGVFVYHRAVSLSALQMSDGHVSLT